jgi:hypothetical protein
MKSNTFAGTSARWYQIVDAEERFMLNSFQYNIKFLWFKKRRKNETLRMAPVVQKRRLERSVYRPNSIKT